MNAIKKMILTWLWKIGYNAGKALASIGDNIFSDAVSQGVKTHLEANTNFSATNLESTLANLGDEWANGIIDAGQGLMMLADMGEQDMMDMFIGMFADEGSYSNGDEGVGHGQGTSSYDAAMALFENHDKWTVTAGGDVFISTANPDVDISFWISSTNGAQVFPADDDDNK